MLAVVGESSGQPQPSVVFKFILVNRKAAVRGFGNLNAFPI